MHSRSTDDRLRVLLVDPCLFTAPYDAALSRGLEANGVVPRWAVRALRDEEAADLPDAHCVALFYPLTDGPKRRNGSAWKLVKGAEHAAGLWRLVEIARTGSDIVHFQWGVVPHLDRMAMQRIAACAPVVLTVHDTTPFNGKSVNWMQRGGFARLLQAADHLIVHTDTGRQTLEHIGIAPDAISVIPHGLLPLRLDEGVAAPPKSRWRIVMFGRLQGYKGVDVLIEALARIDPATRERIEIVIAGEPMIDLDPIRARAVALGVDDMILWRDWRHDDAEMAALLHSADAFVFPYRAIEASGVLFLVADLRRWLIASDLGAFREMLGDDGACGVLVPPEDTDALARALSDSIGRTPTRPPLVEIPDWTRIGAMTLAAYDKARAAHARRAA